MAKNFNPYAEHFGDGDHDGGRDSVPVTCRYCGKTNLEWEDDNGKWVLIDSHTCEVHRCVGKKAKVNVDKLMKEKL